MSMSIFLFFVIACSSQPTTIDLALTNGHVYTKDGLQQTLYINNGLVIETPSSTVEILKEINLEGKFILPSFHDAHTHLLAGAFVFDKLLLVGAMNMNTIRLRVKEYVNTSPDVPWVVGYGWIKSAIDAPTGIELDEVSGDYPVALFDSAGHSVLVNSKAMELAGITADTPTPDGGIIHRDSNGNPTGFLQEAAIELISPLMVSQFSSDQLSSNLLSQISEFHQAGITSVSEILAVPGVNLTFPELYHQYEDLQFRVAYYVPLFAITELSTVESFIGDQSEWVHFEGVKLWIDGSSGSGESWSIEESDIEENHYGSQYFDTEELIKVVEHAETHQYNLKLHVNGDAAVRSALEALEYVQQSNGILNQEYLFEHAVLIAPSDYDRIYNLGITVSIQPAHALVGIYGDQADHWQDERIDRAWDFPALEAAELNIAMGTDWPVWPTVDGLTNWQTATEGLQSRNLKTLTVFNGYTSQGRTTSGLGHVGLNVGQEADFIVLDGNPFEASPNTISLQETWVKGMRVY